MAECLPSSLSGVFQDSLDAMFSDLQPRNFVVGMVMPRRSAKTMVNLMR